MSTSIIFSNYPTLYSYTILAQSGITTTGTTTVSNGYYGNSGGHAQIIGNFSPSTAENNDLTGKATGELEQLITDIGICTQNLNSSSYAGGSQTFYPNINYNSSAITITGPATLIFDAIGDPAAQFFITSNNAITFSNVTMEYKNNASPYNIFWLAGTSITFDTTPVIYGNLIANSGTVTFSVTSPQTETINCNNLNRSNFSSWQRKYHCVLCERYRNINGKRICSN
jgi:hypothetical protein